MTENDFLNYRISIDGEQKEVKIVIYDQYLPYIFCADRTIFAVAENAAAAAQQAAKYWTDLAQNDPETFIACFDPETIVRWLVEKRELREICAQYQGNFWASFDGQERRIDWCDPELTNALNFSSQPEAAYKCQSGGNL